MFQDKYWDPKQRDEPRRLEFDITHLPEGWTVAGLDTLGELTLCVLTTPFEERGGLDAKNALALLGVHYSNKASEGWGGDRLVLLAKGEARALYFASVWDTAQDAREFREALVKLRESKAPAAEAWRKSLSGFELSTAASETDDTVWLRAEWKNDAAKNPLPRILPWEEVRPATPSAGASSH